MKTFLNIGLVGCGMIADIYLQNLTSVFHNELQVRGVFDMNAQLMHSRAEKYGIGRCYESFEAMLADPEIDIVLNLCPPKTHYALNRQAIEAGKHVYCEKPLSVTYAEGAQLEALAREKGVYLGCSPDVPLGALIQTARSVVESGEIGTVIGASAHLVKQGVETWHPNPDFLYQPGAGPLLDMGPYYLTALLHMVGPFSSVSGMSAISFPTRKITSQPHYGETIQVRVPTYVNALLRFSSGAVATFTATFDVWKAKLPFLEVYGSKGSLSISDPNLFGGKIELADTAGEWREVPLTFGYSDNNRGLGLADMAHGILTGGQSRVDAKYAVHILETMDAILESASTGTRVELKTCPDRPAAMTK